MVRLVANRLRGGKLWLIAGVLAAAPQPASAFYWPGWPGSGVTEPPGVPQQIILEVPPGKTPTDPTDPPKHVPEPVTFALAAIGLAGVGFARWRRRKLAPN